MALPPIATASGGLVRDGIWTLSRAKPDPRVNSFLPPFQATQDQLVAAMAARRTADNLAIEAAGATAYAHAQVRAAIISMGTKAFGFFESRTDPKYLWLFPTSPSLLSVTPLDKRGKAFDELVERAKDKSMPKELAEPVKTLAAAVAAWKAASDAEDKAGKAVAGALATERQAADAWHTAVRTLKFQIGTVFPRDPGQVNSYFPKVAASKKAKVVAPVDLPLDGPVAPQ